MSLVVKPKIFNNFSSGSNYITGITLKYIFVNNIMGVKNAPLIISASRNRHNILLKALLAMQSNLPITQSSGF